MSAVPAPAPPEADPAERQTEAALNSNVSRLLEPIEPDQPCGLDLDMAGDDAFLNCLAGAEGLLPPTFFIDGEPFDRSSLDIAGQTRALEALLERTRDLRLLTTLARFRVLGNDLEGFASAVETCAALLDRYWDEVHPQAEGGAHAMRAPPSAHSTLPP